MEKWDFLNGIADEYGLQLEADQTKAVLTDRKTGAYMEIYREEYPLKDPKGEVYVEYIVYFSTQHRHIEDLSDALEYIRSILTDEVLPVEFYLHGERRFGGEIQKSDFDSLSTEFLADYFGYSAAYISQFEYEIHSWSGKYNVERQMIKMQ